MCCVCAADPGQVSLCWPACILFCCGVLIGAGVLRVT